MKVYHRAKADFKSILHVNKWVYHFPLPESGVISRAQQATWWAEGNTIACTLQSTKMTFQVTKET
jgi:hypothetical protein